MRRAFIIAAAGVVLAALGAQATPAHAAEQPTFTEKFEFTDSIQSKYPKKLKKIKVTTLLKMGDRICTALDNDIEEYEVVKTIHDQLKLAKVKKPRTAPQFIVDQAVANLCVRNADKIVEDL